MRAIIPGSFDPVTIGHISLVKKAVALFDSVTVLLCHNFDKKSLFTPEERIELLRASTKEFETVTVEYHTGWLYEYLKERDDVVLFKGVRNADDFDYERKMAEFNFEHSGKETLFSFSDDEFEDISSTKVRELLASGGEWKPFIPQNAQKMIEIFYTNI